ncbi:GntR family transcriptional regulator [Lactonifactor longoviformis]|uniref:DNA-binding transcriptional regulator, GntR family n=1 Tax=Lactonifactor longoviformis DSM 17459 TaxID=1122155 RepID=A0A1M4U0J4_9CLOT|nr:GntR family transcriptional regulator [Lactonifactor longoviformis]POP30767.1 GntR family transcriptional regulator [Lactonifactor longoviformis]SHE50114.1 DNA-binding transcriptional regulator, GntR family [Lactonifactor longoviformis DSM 17459]
MILKKKQTLNDQIYEHIKTSILNGEILQGEKIIPDELALKLNVSKTPIRDAINRLLQDRLLEKDTNSIFVHIMSDEEISMLEEAIIAQILAGYRLCVLKGKRISLIHMLEQRLREQRDAIEIGDMKSNIKSAMEFDKSFVLETENIHLIQNIERSFELFQIMVANYQSDTDNQHISYEDHADILQAAKNQEIEVMEGLIMQHLHSSTQRVKQEIGRK